MLNGSIYPLPVALVGLGRMGAYLAQALRGHPRLEVVVVVDPSPGTAERARSLLGVEVPVVADLESAIGSFDLTGAIVASPTPSHPELVATALAAGLHVFCEKPLALDPSESDRLAAQAEAAHLTLQVGFFRRFSKPWLSGRKALRDGAVGEISYIRSTTWDKVLPDPRFCDPAVSGGLLVDNGVHEFDVIEWLAGSEIRRVACVNAPSRHPELEQVGDVDCSSVLLEMDSGVGGVIELSRNARYGDDMRTEILGADGAIFIATFPDGVAEVGGSGGLSEIEGSAVDDGFMSGVAGELEAFSRVIAGEELEVPGARESSRAMRAALAAGRAAETEAWVELPVLEAVADGSRA